nr:MAG: ORF1 [TTV-like mini virus]
MPFWRYNYRRPWRPYRRRYWRRRASRFVRRRTWRRRKYRVRKRKAKTIKLKEFQPHYIRKLKVNGTYPLFLTTSKRLSNNMCCYLESFAPHDWPGGGGFSILNFSLYTLYKENLIARNYWTTSNENMPLIRYLGCKMTLYSQPEVDYLFYYHNAYPMQASKLTYMSSHPQIMIQTKHVKVIRCRRFSKRKKPYKKFFIQPPAQMQNRWYFQHDIATVPLLQTIATACSLDRTFLHANAQSSTIGFKSIDTTELQNHDFTNMGTQGYLPIHDQHLFGVLNAPIKHDISEIEIGNLVYLGTTDYNQIGMKINEIPNGSFVNKLQKAMQQSGFMGNPFHKEWLHNDTWIVKTNKTYNQLKDTYTQANTKLLKTDFSFKNPLIMDCRYNPFADKGKDNKIYLLKVTGGPHSDDLQPPAEPELIWENLPLWLLTWGYLDFQKKCGIQSQIDTNSMVVIVSPYIQPQKNKIYIPIDQYFVSGNSPWESNHLEPSDHYKWHPKVRYQVDTINTIASTGPFTVKLPDRISCEAHLKYQFYFKVGGEPAPMSVTIDPTEQPKYNIPSNILQPHSLQSPTTPIENFLWKFDERRGYLTKKALQRIQTDFETEKDAFSITDPSTTVPIKTQKEIQTSDSSTSEEEEAPLETQLLHERRKQKLLRKRINQLLNRLTKLE